MSENFTRTARAAQRCALHISAIAALCASAPALAYTQATNPNTTPPVIPGTSTPVNIWKFVGTIPGSSAVQVHPWWILSSNHGIPAVGATFTNSYGTASVSWCAPRLQQVDADISLCLINPPINPPAGVAFPTLLSDGGQTFPAATKKSQASGYLFGTGFGFPTFGTQSAAWSTPNGRALLYHPLTNPSAVAPTKEGGDSGSGMFWFAQGQAQGVLIGTIAGTFDFSTGVVYFSPTIRAWIETYAAELSWTTASQYTATRLAPLPQQVKVTSTTANSASIQINKPLLQPADALTGYFVAARKNGTSGLSHMASVDDLSATVPYTFTGLQTNATYSFCAFSYNDSGLANFSGTPTAAPECGSFTPTNPPGAPTNLQVTLVETPAPGVYRYRLSWTAPAPVTGATVTGYRFAGTAYNGTGVSASETSFDQFIVTSAQRPFTVSVRAVNQLTPGPASNSVTVP